MRRLAVIPARGGSKRIPRKNIRLFAGRPILAWPVAAARDSELFDTVMVSTDDAEIAEAARTAGADVPFTRRPETADDHTGLIDVLAEVLAGLEARGERFDQVCCILATAALVTPGRLAEGLALLETGRSSVYPVLAFASPIQRALERDADGATRMADPSAYATRSQDLPPRYHDAGQFYWLTAETIRARNPILNTDAASLVIDEMEAQDIDTEADWRLAELKHRLREAG